MKAIWKGSISFGLVNIPVAMHSVCEPKSITFTVLCRDCQMPLRYKRICTSCNKEIPWDQVVKGFEFEKGHFVVFSKEEIESISALSTKHITIIGFAEPTDIDPVYFSKHYYISPEKGAEKAFYLLHTAMSLKNIVAICKVVVRNKEYIGLIRPYKKILIVTLLHYESEIRKPPSECETFKLSKEEVTLATNLIEALKKEFKLTDFKDEFRTKLEELIKQKVGGKSIVIQREKEVTATKDLMGALEESIKQIARTKK
jgi:DNA end-binding protein Ku